MKIAKPKKRRREKFSYYTRLHKNELKRLIKDVKSKRRAVKRKSNPKRPVKTEQPKSTNYPVEKKFKLKNLKFSTGQMIIASEYDDQKYILRDIRIKTSFNDHIEEYALEFGGYTISLVIYNNKISKIDASDLIKKFKYYEDNKDKKEKRIGKLKYKRKLQKLKDEEARRESIKKAKQRADKNYKKGEKHIGGWWPYKK